MRVILGIFLVVWLSACATAYQQDGFGGGFSETQFDENVWRVTFRGNGYTQEPRAEDLALLRSAELTLENGYTYFALTDSKSSKKTGTFTTPTTSRTTGSAYSSGNSTYLNATTHTSGGQTFFVSKPSITNTVVMFKDKPEVQGMVYNAKFICQSLGEKYEVTCGTPR